MKTIFVALLCMIVLIGCDDCGISPPSSAQASIYFPLQIGNTWKYIKTDMNGDTLDFYNEVIESTEDFGGKTYFIITRTNERDKKPLSPKHYRVENDKVYLGNKEGNSESLYIDFSHYYDDIDVGYVTSTFFHLETKVGILNKVKTIKWKGYLTDSPPVNNYAPNIGLVTSSNYTSYDLIYAKIGDKVYK